MKKLVLVLGAFAVLGVAACQSNSSSQDQVASHTSPQPVATEAAPAATEAPSSPPTPSFTVPQQQAIASAESYLTSEQGFSKLGLIDQLSSKYGEGFSHHLAVFAVDHLRVNWKHQAVISARSYMNSQPGWSYSGLVDQLSSPYGENFTLSQAEYAAHKVGL